MILLRRSIGNEKKLFRDLAESMTQMNEIVRGERAPSHEFYIDADSIKALRVCTRDWMSSG